MIVASLFERRAPGIYHNTAAIIDADGTYLGKYRKMHIPDDPLFYEKFYFTPGDLGFQAWDTKFARIGVCVCWDQWYPEAARLTALRGAQILFYPTAIGWHPEGKGSNTARGSIPRGRRSSAATPWRMAATLPCPIASVTKPLMAAKASNSGAKALSATLPGQIVEKASADKEEVVVAEATWTLWRRSARIGRFSGTGESTLTARSPDGLLIRLGLVPFNAHPSASPRPRPRLQVLDAPLEGCCGRNGPAAEKILGSRRLQYLLPRFAPQERPMRHPSIYPPASTATRLPQRRDWSSGPRQTPTSCSG